MPFPTSRTCARWAACRTLIPKTYWMMIIGTLALTGVGIPATIIGTAGFFSKDAIIEGAFAGHNAVAGFAFMLLVVAAASPASIPGG